MSADILQTMKIENWDLRFKFRSLVGSASLLREYDTSTLTPTSRRKPVAPTIFMVKTCDARNLTYRLIQKKNETPTLTRITLKSVYRPHNHIL